MSSLAPAAQPAPARLVSLDALRGFDMMWIMGADALGNAFAHLNGGPLARLAATQLDHVAWAGIRFYDTIFPLFVFMVGVAIPFSLGQPKCGRRKWRVKQEVDSRKLAKQGIQKPEG